MLIQEFINNEQLLDFALSHLIEKTEQTSHPIAEKILCLYVIDQFGQQGRNFTEQDVQEECNKILASYCLTSLAKKGLIEADLTKENVTYQLTELGKEVVKEIN